MSYLTERTQPVLMANVVAGTSYTAVAAASVDLRAYNADSIVIVATVNATSLTGFTGTATGGASTASMLQLWATAGSSSTVLTLTTTAPAKILYWDLKQHPYRYAGLNHTGLGDKTNVTILGFPYDSKQQPVPLSSDLPSTASGTGYSKTVTAVTS